MTTSPINRFDAIEALIYMEGVRIATLDIQPELDLMTIYLNTKAVLSQPLSSYKLLKFAEKSQLLEFELIGGGTGIHWPQLDEDLSLKGFLQEELRKVVKSKKESLAA